MSNIDDELDALSVNINNLIDVKTKEYAPKITNFFKKINLLIEKTVKESHDRTKETQTVKKKT